MPPPNKPYNPFVLLSPPLLQALTRQPMCFVRQSYPRGKKGDAIPLLLTHYIHHEVDEARAQQHMRLLHHDPYRKRYDSTCSAARQQLEKAAAQPPGYLIYVNLLADNWAVSRQWKKKIDAYLQLHLPYGHYAPTGKWQVTLKDRYGELFLEFVWKHHRTEVLLELIENTQACATT